MPLLKVSKLRPGEENQLVLVNHAHIKTVTTEEVDRIDAAFFLQKRVATELQFTDGSSFYIEQSLNDIYIDWIVAERKQ